MDDVTLILSKIESGDRSASSDLLSVVYDELRKLAAARMARERPDHTLSATALVHEAYVRLVDHEKAQHWDSRGHFFSAAAEVMRRILIDSAMKRRQLKRGGDRKRVDADLFELAASNSIDADLLLDLDARLQELLDEDPQAGEMAKLRIFAGLSVAEAGEVLGVSRSAAYNIWKFVRSWFTLRLSN